MVVVLHLPKKYFVILAIIKYNAGWEFFVPSSVVVAVKKREYREVVFVFHRFCLSLTTSDRTRSERFPSFQAYRGIRACSDRLTYSNTYLLATVITDLLIFI